ncbi:MAG: ArsB/NhaD family transporter [Thermodesulfobacteriota bacterium]
MDGHLIIALAVFIGVYALLIWEKVDRAVVSMLGAGLLIFLGVITQESAIHGIDFNTIGLLIGMMAIVSICQKTGMFQYVAIKSAKLAKGDPWLILLYLSIVTAVLSALLDNVTTVLLIAPITLLICDELKTNPYPFLFSQIMASNIGGAATLIGDPPNIMIGSAKGLSFMAFVTNVGVIMPLVMLVTFIILKLIYGKELTVAQEYRDRIMQFRESEAIQDPVLLVKCLLVLGAVITGFVLQDRIHVEPATTALFGAAFLMLINREDLHHVMGKVEWTTIFFFIGLFVVVHGLVEVGFIGTLAKKALALTGGDIATATYLVLWISAVASALVDNIPFVATMIPLIDDMAPALGGEEAIMPLWWALSIGACLGGNGSIIGASANVIVAGFAARSGHPIGFFKFMKLAFPLMIMSIAISTVYMYLRYL